MSLRHSPTIDELLGDTLVQTVMRADKVEPQSLRTLLANAAYRLATARVERRPRSASKSAEADNRQAGGVPRRDCAGTRPPRAASRPMRVSPLLLASVKP